MFSLLNITINFTRKNKKEKKYKNISGSRIFNDNKNSEISLSEETKMTTEERTEIKLSQRENFRKEMAVFMAHMGFSNNSEAANFLGMSKEWLDNLMHKRSNVRIPTLPDMHKINEVQNSVKSIKLPYKINIWRIIHNEEFHPDIAHLQGAIKEKDDEIQNLKIKLAAAMAKNELYEKMFNKDSSS